MNRSDADDPKAPGNGGHPDAFEGRENGDDRTSDTLELFFDLVFVFAMSQVTDLMLAELSWTGFGHGVGPGVLRVADQHDG